jgi:hypothetical protein
MNNIKLHCLNILSFTFVFLINSCSNNVTPSPQPIHFFNANIITMNPDKAFRKFFCCYWQQDNSN